MRTAEEFYRDIVQLGKINGYIYYELGLPPLETRELEYIPRVEVRSYLGSLLRRKIKQRECASFIRAVVKGLPVGTVPSC